MEKYVPYCNFFHMWTAQQFLAYVQPIKIIPSVNFSLCLFQDIINHYVKLYNTQAMSLICIPILLHRQLLIFS